MILGPAPYHPVPYLRKHSEGVAPGGGDGGDVGGGSGHVRPGLDHVHKVRQLGLHGSGELAVVPLQQQAMGQDGPRIV